MGIRVENKRDTNDKTWQYDAFISYRHSELDSFVAETLHRQLENFKLPGSVVKQKKAELLMQAKDQGPDVAGQKKTAIKTRIHRVFRDREELPLVANLADPITDALENSEYLIVICSPRLNQSMWCRKEIETFIEMHDREHVLAVLVEGEPDTSFPEELLYREEEEIQPDGSVIMRKIPVEPLAADVRGTDHREIKKKIKSELLRLAAPMFDCNYDDLKQRHKEQRTRKIIMTSVSVSAVCLLFGVVSTTMALRIQHQNTQIKEQAVEIAAQADEIETQYKKAKQDACISQTREGRSYLEDGDRMKAIATIQDAIWDLPDRGNDIYQEGNMIEEDMDYPAQAVYALTDSLYLYENGQQILPDRLLEADSTIQYMKLSPEGSRIVTMDLSGQLTVWNPEDTSTRIKLAIDSGSGSYEEQVAFFGEDKLFCPGENDVILYDISGETAEELYRISCQDYVGVLVQQEKKIAILMREEGYCAIDCQNGSILYESDWDMDELIARMTAKSVMSEDGCYWAVTLSNSYYSDAEQRRVAIYDTASGECLNSYEIGYEYIHSMRFDGDRIYVVSNHSGDFQAEQLTLGMEGRLQAFDVLGATAPIWTFEQHNGWLYETSYAHMENSDYLICSGYGEVIVLNKQDGSYIDTFSFGTEVVRIANYVGSDNFLAFTRDGVWHYLSMKRMEDMVSELFPKCTSANVKDFAIGDGYCVTLPYNSRELTVYKRAQGIGLEEFYTGEDDYREAAVSRDSSYLAAAFYNDSYTTAIDLFDTQTGEKLWSYEEEDSYYQGMCFGEYNGTEALVLVTDEAIHTINIADGGVIVSYPVEFSGFVYKGSDETGQYLYLWDDETIYCYGVQAADYVYTMAPEGMSDYDAVALAHNREFYGTADQETRTLRFYEMGKTEAFLEYDEQMLGTDINFAYIETMFFGAGDEHLYIVYRDGRIMTFDIEPDNRVPEYFCVNSKSPDGYDALSDIMVNCREITDSDYAIMSGNSDSYLVEARTGELLAHLHGFLAYNEAAGKLYLHSGDTIYQIPLYTLEEMDRFATENRDGSEWAYRIG